ncbi:hypothetical protein AB6A40_001610 [Gnathostoma spinigerum]|uniref:Nucleoside diphosphate kinase-like domain-containing protein n=1 Tax=Gnathostoma spinigerum TaxID=75299 RepID=A0ABD6E5U5_9BILA
MRFVVPLLNLLSSRTSSTFAMIKPEAVAYPFIAKEILNEIIKNGIEIVGAKRIRLNRNDAERLYRIHQEKFFYERLIQHVTSGPVIVMRLRCSSGDAIERWRTLMGSSKVFRNMLNNRKCLRARFAISDTRNLVHGADSVDTSNYELQLFGPYPPYDQQKLIAQS